jgi:ABC-2 type transport system ATP-binding protein
MPWLRRSALVVSLLTGALMLSLPPVEASTVEHTSTPSRIDGLLIHMSVYKPASASPTSKVPVVLHSHGFGGSRTRGAGAFTEWLSAGFGVVSFDQRGFGETGGVYQAMHPDFEGQDVKSVIDHIATYDWVRKDVDAEGNEIADDPVLGAIGGSYGGGYQMVGALTEIRDEGRTRFNALAPEITWHNIAEGLAPNDVPRTLWISLLTAVSASTMPEEIRNGVLQAYATGTMPNGEIPGTANLKERFRYSSPEGFLDEGVHLDIPVIFGQGTSDNLLPLNHARDNFEKVLTDEARARSLVVGYNGGHGLPSVLPLGTLDVNVGESAGSGGDQCSPQGFASLARDFFAETFAGRNGAALMPTAYSITSADSSTCLRAETLDPTAALPVEPGVVASPSTGGMPLSYKVLDGPATVIGVPVLQGRLTALGAETRAFVGVSVGATPATARLVQNNTIPLRQRFPVVGGQLELELPGIGIEILEGEHLYLTISAISDMFVGNNRYPGALVIEDAVLHVPARDSH